MKKYAEVGGLGKKKERYLSDFGENFLLDLCPTLSHSDGNFGQSYAVSCLEWLLAYSLHKLLIKKEVKCLGGNGFGAMGWRMLYAGTQGTWGTKSGKQKRSKEEVGDRTSDLLSATGNVMVLRTQPINRPTLTPSWD